MQECKKCGVCCEKSGPTLHIEDKYLVNNGSIQPTKLVTLRIGEKAFDPISNQNISLDKEIIKIKGSSNTWRCRYYNPDEKNCSIYAKRPVECRLLKCWDTKALLSMMNKNLLTREILFDKIEGLYDLIVEHEKKCSYQNIEQLLRDLDSNNNTNSLNQLKEIILFDINIREMVEQRQAAAGKMIDLLFGRPLLDTISQFKFKAQYSKDKGLVIKPFKVDKILEGTIS